MDTDNPFRRQPWLWIGASFVLALLAVIASERIGPWATGWLTAALVLWGLSAFAAIVGAAAPRRPTWRGAWWRTKDASMTASAVLLGFGVVMGLQSALVAKGMASDDEEVDGTAPDNEEIDSTPDDGDGPSPTPATPTPTIEPPPTDPIPDGYPLLPHELPPEQGTAWLVYEISRDLAGALRSIAATAENYTEAVNRLSQLGGVVAEEIGKTLAHELASVAGDWLRQRLLDDPAQTAEIEEAVREVLRAEFESLYGDLDERLIELLDDYVSRVMSELEQVAGEDLPDRSAGVARLGGQDRYATAAAIARDAYPLGSPVVYVATGEDFPDALAAGAVTGLLDAPLLLVTADATPESTRQALQSLKPRRIVVVGGEHAIGRDVYRELQSLLVLDAG